MSRSAALKRWPGWLVLFLVLAALLAIGVQRASAPQTADQRELRLYQRLACPVCDGESVAESRAESANQIREVVAQLVVEGKLTDDEIVAKIDASYPQELELIPSGSGIDLLIWILPAMAFVGACAGLIAVFLRWRRAPSTEGPSAADRALVAAAMAGADDESIAADGSVGVDVSLGADGSVASDVEDLAR